MQSLPQLPLPFVTAIVPDTKGSKLLASRRDSLTRKMAPAPVAAWTGPASGPIAAKVSKSHRALSVRKHAFNPALCNGPSCSSCSAVLHSFG